MSRPSLSTFETSYSRIKRVSSFQELVSTPFAAGVNALCWERTMPCDFSEVMARLGAGDGITVIDESRLRALPVSAAAVGFLLEDLRLLREHGLEPELNRIDGYPRDPHPGPVSTDVFSFHVDSAPAEIDTWMCTYYGPPSEGLRNDEGQRLVDIPATRAALLKVHGGRDDADFRRYLKENCFDLHYAPALQARPFSFGLGTLWRIAVDYPGSPVPPFIHRAPSPPVAAPRLLLIA